MAFATMIGGSRSKLPYTSHNVTPEMNATSQVIERSAVDRVRQLRTTCGRKLSVVIVPAT
jgi:hypothetical protein